MDSHNLFLTKATYRLLRAEYGAVLIAAVVLALVHVGQIRWPVFVGMFAYIDVIGYLPGAVAYRRARGGDISRRFYVLYNSTHSLLSAGAVAGAWCLLVRPEWALLALPIHLCGDRAIFGNFLKPFGLSFEPVTHPAYKELVKHFDILPDRKAEDSRVQLAALEQCHETGCTRARIRIAYEDPPRGSTAAA